jgi:hypothetical protein
MLMTLRISRHVYPTNQQPKIATASVWASPIVNDGKIDGWSTHTGEEQTPDDAS